MTNKVVRYKLVNQDYTTHGGTKWKQGKTVRATGIGNTMCTNQVLHCYSNPYLAVLFNPIHANIQNPRMIKVECTTIIADDGLKQACKEQTRVGEQPVPTLTILQKVEFAIRVAMLQYTDASFLHWANQWITGKDRTESAARSAESAAESAAWSAARSAAWSAASAARSAESAARSAAESAAESAARSAVSAAESAARSAAWSAARSAIGRKFVEIITDIVENPNAH